MGEFESHTPEENFRSPENRTERWGSEQFQKYLSRLSLLGSEGAESIHRFPRHIELDQQWQETLFRLREASRDRRERYAPFGLSEKEEWILPQDFLIGERHEITTLNRIEVKNRYGIVYPAGDVHSHPRKTRFEKYSTKAFTYLHLLGEQGGFSAIDCFRILRGARLSHPALALVDEDDQFFLFRTRETINVSDQSPFHFHLKEDFGEYWARKFGFILQKDGRARMRFNADIWKMNIGIAEAYKLALYRGKPRQDLMRAYPY